MHQLSLDQLKTVLREICQTHPAVDDAVRFELRGIRVETIREPQEQSGARARIPASVGDARSVLRVDVGFEDAIVPEPVEIDYPVLLDLPPPFLKGYQRETVVAEKFEAIVWLGIATSRMKDLCDLWVLASEFTFDGPRLASALQATFSRRGTKLPEAAPPALTEEFSRNAEKRRQWRAFLDRSAVTGPAPGLEEVTGLLHEFLLPVARALRSSDRFKRRWEPPGPWH